MAKASNIIPPPEPTSEDWAAEQRIAAWRQYQELLACQHGELFLDASGEAPVCSNCRRPMHYISDVQLSNMLNKERESGKREANGS
jgi:hypothetical protein